MKFGSELTKLYAVVTQGFITIIVLIVIGFFIGYKIDKDSAWPIILAVIGGLAGIVGLITMLLKLKIGGEDKNGRDS